MLLQRWRGGMCCLPAGRLFLFVALLLSITSVTVSAQTAGRAGLVVLHSDGRLITRCIEFAEAEISGYDLLLRSGLDLNAERSSMGMAICRIDQVGCTTPQEPCFCAIEDGRQLYWSYWQRRDGSWVYSQLGASNSRVRPGMVDAWIWGSGEPALADALQNIGFEQVCAPPPTATPSPTPTETPAPTDTPTATFTPLPTPTPLPTSTPTNTPPPIPTATPWPTLAPIAPTPPARTPEPVWSPPPSATTSPTPTEIVPLVTGPTVFPTNTPLPALQLPPTPTATRLTLPPLIETFYADPPVIIAGQPVRLVWSTRRVHSVTLEAVDITGATRQGRVDAAGELLLAPTQTTRYRLTAWQGDLYAERELEVHVAAPPDTPTPPVQETPPPRDDTPMPPGAPPSAVLTAPIITPAPTSPPGPITGLAGTLLLLAIGALLVLGVSLLGLVALIALTWLLTDLR